MLSSLGPFNLVQVSGIQIGPNVPVSIIPSIPAGSNLIGKTGIDQTSPGITNAISIAQLNTTNIGTPVAANIPTLPSINRQTALYLSGSQAVNTGGTLTTVTMAAMTELGNTIFDAQTATVVIQNPSGSAQSITSATLTFTDTGTGAIITYPLPFTPSNIASNTQAVVSITMQNGVLTTPKINITFAANPTNGTVSVLMILSSEGDHTSPKYLNISGTATASYTGTASPVAPIDAFDLSGYRWASIQITGIFSATYIFEGSNTGSILSTEWIAVPMGYIGQSAGLPPISTNTVTNTLYHGPTPFRYFRVRCSVYVSGTIIATCQFSSAGLINNPTVNVPSDAMTIAYGPSTISETMLYNNSKMDLARNNFEQAIFTSAARTIAQTSSDLINYNARGIKLIINITATSGSSSLTVAINGKSTNSNIYYNILTSAALTHVQGNQNVVMTVYPNITAVSNISINDILPRIWQVVVTVGTADSVTYSIDANYVL